MKTQKQIAGRYRVSSPHMVGDGFRVYNYFPNGNRLVEEVSPFLMLDYGAPHHFPPTTKQRGVGSHPHRGFETVTIAYEGSVAHRDSRGNAGIIGPGDVQWMRAASGVLHEEFHEKKFAAKGGIFHMIQLWVNLPRSKKMSEPKYQTLLSADMGKYIVDEKGSVVNVIAGEFNGIRGPAETASPVHLYDVRLQAGAEVSISLPSDFNTSLLVTKGKVNVNNEMMAEHKDFIHFKNEGEQLSIHAEEESWILVLSGEPIQEPVVSYGPFVMNTKEEIAQAIEDFHSGKFGELN
jgi:hypothetical protein